MRLEVFRYFVLLQLHNNDHRMEYKMHCALSCLSSHTNIFPQKCRSELNSNLSNPNGMKSANHQTRSTIRLTPLIHTFTHEHLKNDQFNKCFAKTNTYLENLNNNRERFSSLKSPMLYILLLEWCSIQFHCCGFSFSLSSFAIITLSRLRAYDEC